MNNKNYLLKLLMVFTILFTFTNCDIEQNENSTDTITLEGQDASGLATVSIEQTIDYFESRKNNLFAKGEDNLDLEIDLSSLRQAEITNTDAKINLIDATTKFNNVESTVIQIEIDGTLQTILYNVIPENNSQSRSETNSTSRYNFTGNVVITNLAGNVLNNFEYNSGALVGEVNLSSYSNNDGTEPCWGITCGIDLDTVYLSNASNSAYTHYANTANVIMYYQFVRSTNNYVSMGQAYANYYRSLEAESWNNITLESDGEKIDPVEETKCFDKTQGGELTIYVQQPNENSLDLVGDNQVGHVFVSIEQNGRRRVFGFYPPESASDASIAVGNTYNSELRDNSGDLYHLSISTNINASQMNNILNYVQNHPPQYNLNNYACTDFGITVGNLGGLNLPSTTMHHWLGFDGRSPAKLGQEIRVMNSSPNRTITKTKGDAPSKTNDGC